MVLNRSSSYNIRIYSRSQFLPFNILIVSNSKGKVFCLNACGGSGKTYTINLLLTAERAQGGIAMGTALSGYYVRHRVLYTLHMLHYGKLAVASKFSVLV